MTYIIDNHIAFENLKERLTAARDEFAHYAPTGHGLVVRNSKENVKLRKVSKRKIYGKSSNAKNKKTTTYWYSWCGE